MPVSTGLSFVCQRILPLGRRTARKRRRRRSAISVIPLRMTGAAVPEEAAQEAVVLVQEAQAAVVLMQEAQEPVQEEAALEQEVQEVVQEVTTLEQEVQEAAALEPAEKISQAAEKPAFLTAP